MSNSDIIHNFSFLLRYIKKVSIMYIKADDNLKTLYKNHLLSDAQYDLMNKILHHTANERGQTNLLFVAASDSLRTLFTNAVISTYATQDSPLIFVQDFQRLQAKHALSFTYDEIDYPFLKVSQRIENYQGIIIDSLTPRAAAMQALTAINQYPLGIVTIEANNIPTAFRTLYRIQKPLRKFKQNNAMLMNAFINNLFDYVFLLRENKPLELYAFGKAEKTERIVDWDAVLKVVW